MIKLIALPRDLVLPNGSSRSAIVDFETVPSSNHEPHMQFALVAMVYLSVPSMANSNGVFIALLNLHIWKPHLIQVTCAVLLKGSRSFLKVILVSGIWWSGYPFIRNRSPEGTSTDRRHVKTTYQLRLHSARKTFIHIRPVRRRFSRIHICTLLTWLVFFTEWN